MDCLGCFFGTWQGTTSPVCAFPYWTSDLFSSFSGGVFFVLCICGYLYVVLVRCFSTTDETKQERRVWLEGR